MIAAVLALVATASGWHDARTIVVPHATLPAYVRLALPQSIDGGPDGSYPDVRIADEHDRGVPYALDADRKILAGGAVSLSDVGFVPGAFTQAIADLGGAGELHTSISIETSRPTFFERVQIATSDDRKTWSVVAENALIYRVVEDSDNGRSSVEFGPSRARWLRIRILDGVRLFPITGASLPTFETPPELVPLSAAQTIRQAGTKTVATFDFGTPNTNLDAVGFESSTPQFNRAVELAADDGASTEWQVFSSTDVTRYPGARYVEFTHLAIQTGYRFTRRLRVTIQNGDDQPLADLRVTPLGFQHHVVFMAQPGQRYRLLWNNPGADAAVYDLGDRLEHQAWVVGAVATLGGPASAAFGAPSALDWAAWLQNAALPIALAFLCVVLLIVALVAMRPKPAV